MSALLLKILDFLIGLLTGIRDVIFTALGWIIAFLVSVVQYILIQLDVVDPSDFQATLNSMSDTLCALNYYFPIAESIAALQTGALTVGTVFVFRIVRDLF